MNPIVSVIVPIYNGEKYVQSCKESMDKQTYKELEIILVDDGSKDNTGAMCDEWASCDSRVVVIHQQNKGLSGARNAGINEAKGEFVVFIDVDDEIDPNLVKDNVELAEKNNADIVMYCFSYYDVDTGTLTPNGMNSLFVGTKEEYFRHMLIPTMDTEVFNAPWNKLIRKSVLFDNNVFFDPNFPIYEDILFAAKILAVCEKIVVNNNIYYKYFVRSSGSLITKFYEKFFASITEYNKFALKYCNQFDNNEEQIKRMSLLYSVLGIMHIKQIVCQNSLDKKRKFELIKRICDDNGFVHSLEISNLNSKKSIVRFLVKNGHYKGCYYLYRIQAKFEK